VLPADVYELTGVADPRLSPDGRSVAYVVWRIDRDANAVRSSIWVVPLDGPGEPRRLTAGDARHAEPRWSPDGRRIAFVSDRGGGPAQLHVVSADGGEPLALSDLPESVSQVMWSPDGTRIAFSSRVRAAAYGEEDQHRRAPRRITRLRFKLDDVGWTSDRRRHLFTLPSDGSQPPAQLTYGDFEDGSPAWSPDGRRIAFASGREPDWDRRPYGDLYVVDAAGGEPEQLTRGGGDSDVPVWSPDGGLIAHSWTPGIFDSPHHAQIAVIPAEGGERRVLTEQLDRNCFPYPPIREPLWDGGRIVFGIEDRGNVHVYAVDAAGGSEPELLVGGEVYVTGYDAAAGTLVHSARTAMALSELYAGERRLTDAGAAFCAGREIVAPERFTATSADGTEVDAWLVRPTAFDPSGTYPLLLSIHGGPFTQYTGSFFDEFQVYAGAGYAVVYANPRGSSGYSEGYGRAIRGPVGGGPGWGTRDHEDLQAVVDEALRRFPFCDGERLGVLGGSYGGYMTTWIAAHEDRFKAAISERALTSFVSHFGGSDIGWAMKGYTGAHLFEDLAAHVDRSPITYAADITTPLLVLHSEDDLRCPVEQGELLFTVLRLLGREVEMVRFDGESHELSRSGSPVHRVQRFEVILDWFARHLS
jgi:dipeptidyl aminopeptidase/acylaminoacyl peptidase